MVRPGFVLLLTAALVTLLLCGPVPAAGGGRLSAPDTGIEGIFTAQDVISDDAHHVLMGHVIVAQRDGDTHIALIIQQRRDGVHYLRYGQAFSGGVELPFRRMGGTGCTHGHCRDRPIGLITLSVPMLTRFATTGLQARLTGRSGAIRLTVPAPLFAEALERGQHAGLIAPPQPD